MKTPTIARGVVAKAYRAPWSFAYWEVVATALLAAGVTKRGEAGGILTDAEMLELGEAMTSGVTPEQFAERIMDRVAAEETRIRRAEWLYENAEGAA